MDEKPKLPQDLPKNVSEIYRRERKRYEKQKMVNQYQLFHGSKYQVLQVNKHALERSRLSGSGMTSEERFLRAQYKQDLKLAADEPRYVPELRPQNFFRRLFQWPWDKLFNSLRLVIPDPALSLMRRTIPRTLFGATIFYYVLYHNLYRKSTWERKGGLYWMPFGERPQLYPDDPFIAVEKTDTDFQDMGFQARKACADVDTAGSWTNYPDRYPVTYYKHGDSYGFLNKPATD